MKSFGKLDKARKHMITHKDVFHRSQYMIFVTLILNFFRARVACCKGPCRIKLVLFILVS